VDSDQQPNERPETVGLPPPRVHMWLDADRKLCDITTGPPVTPTSPQEYPLCGGCVWLIESLLGWLDSLFDGGWNGAVEPGLQESYELLRGTNWAGSWLDSWQGHDQGSEHPILRRYGRGTANESAQ
jgi:hypothetical protein